MKAKKTYKGGGLLDKLKEKVSSLKAKKEAPKEFDKTGYKFLGKSDDLNAIAHRKKIIALHMVAHRSTSLQKTLKERQTCM